MLVGITGGIASGKTTICKILEENSYSIFYSDIEAKKIANTNQELKLNIIKLFGSDSYINGVYNSDYIRNIVFNDADKLDQLNKCFGNYVINAFLIQSQSNNISIFESALIFEHNLDGYFDLIIGVSCDESVVYERIKNRNGFNDVEIKNIISKQLPQKYKNEICDITIDTTNGISSEYILKIFNNIKQNSYV